MLESEKHVRIIFIIFRFFFYSIFAPSLQITISHLFSLLCIHNCLSYYFAMLFICGYKLEGIFVRADAVRHHTFVYVCVRWRHFHKLVFVHTVCSEKSDNDTSSNERNIFLLLLWRRSSQMKNTFHFCWRSPSIASSGNLNEWQRCTFWRFWLQRIECHVDGCSPIVVIVQIIIQSAIVFPNDWAWWKWFFFVTTFLPTRKKNKSVYNFLLLFWYFLSSLSSLLFIFIVACLPYRIQCDFFFSSSSVLYFLYIYLFRWVHKRGWNGKLTTTY